MKNPQQGFTLIEIMIVVAILGILASIALPAYTQYIREGRRVDGQASLSRIEVAQEKWRVSNPAYTETLSNLGVASTSADGHYTLSVSGASATAYTATATATGTQASDTVCASMTITLASGSTTRAPAACWKK